MYTEWASLTPTITSNVNGAQSHSVLTKFSGSSGVAVAVAVSFLNLHNLLLYHLKCYIIFSFISSAYSQSYQPINTIADHDGGITAMTKDAFNKYLASAKELYPSDAALWSQFEMNYLTINAGLDDIITKYKQAAIYVIAF